jgi:hypothetical protein
MCLASTCSLTPLATCRTAQKSLLLLKNKMPDDKDRLVWKWIKGMSTSQLEFADPTSTSSYALCIYDTGGANLIATMDVPASSTKWSAISDKGYKYDDPAHTADGAFKIKLKGSTANKSKALVKGRGAELPDTDTAAITLPVKVQLVNNGNGKCFESTFTAAKTQTSSKFKAKSP